jgi:Hypoxia induced protein conserved region
LRANHDKIRANGGLIDKEVPMDIIFKFLAVVAIAAVTIVLLIGLRNMMKGGDANFSNRMMQLRIFLQLIAIILIVGAIYFHRSAG